MKRFYIILKGDGAPGFKSCYDYKVYYNDERLDNFKNVIDKIRKADEILIKHYSSDTDIFEEERFLRKLIGGCNIIHWAELDDGDYIVVKNTVKNCGVNIDLKNYGFEAMAV